MNWSAFWLTLLTGVALGGIGEKFAVIMGWQP